MSIIFQYYSTRLLLLEDVTRGDGEGPFEGSAFVFGPDMAFACATCSLRREFSA